MPANEELVAAAAELRRAFSHIESPDTHICAWLDENQKAALQRYQECLGLKANAYGELPESASADEVRLVRRFAVQLHDEAVLESEQDRAYATDLRLLQYLRARDLHLERAHAMLLQTLKWRKENQAWQLENLASKTDKTVSDARIVGYDTKGRVVVYSSLSQTYKRTPKDVEVNAAATMEKAALCATLGSPGNLIWVNNFAARHKNGFGFRDCQPAFFFSGINIFSNHYPECLKTMLIVDPPSIFFTMWSVIKPMLPIATQEKAAFLDSRNPVKMKEELHKLFGEELGDFLAIQIKKDSP